LSLAKSIPPRAQHVPLNGPAPTTFRFKTGNLLPVLCPCRLGDPILHKRGFPFRSPIYKRPPPTHLPPLLFGFQFPAAVRSAFFTGWVQKGIPVCDFIDHPGQVLHFHQVFAFLAFRMLDAQCTWPARFFFFEGFISFTCIGFGPISGYPGRSLSNGCSFLTITVLFFARYHRFASLFFFGPATPLILALSWRSKPKPFLSIPPPDPSAFFFNFWSWFFRSFSGSENLLFLNVVPLLPFAYMTPQRPPLIHISLCIFKGAESACAARQQLTPLNT